MPSQTQVYVVCSCIHAANYLLSREFQSGRPPQFLCIKPKLAARHVQGAQQLLPGARKALTKHLEAQELTN